MSNVYKYDKTVTSEAEMAMMLLAKMSRGERLRIIAAILMAQAELDESDTVSFTVKTSDGEYKVRLTKED